MPDSVRSFNEHSTVKLWCEILVSHIKNSSFQHFCIRCLRQYCTETVNYIQFRAPNCRKYALHQKTLQMKIVQNWISYKKVPERIYLSPPECSWETEKIDMVKILYCTETAYYIQFRAQHRQKYALHREKLQIKVVHEFHTKKSVSAYVYIPQSGARRLQRLIWLKYYIVLKRQITFNLGLNADKNTDNKRKGSNKNCLESISYKKKIIGCISISPRSGARAFEFVFK